MTGAAVEVDPVFETVFAEFSSSQIVPAKIDCRTAVWSVLTLRDPATIGGTAMPTTFGGFAVSYTGMPSLIQNTSRSPASALLLVKKSRLFHGRSRKA